MFTDIEGSTVLWQRSPQMMKRLLPLHDELIRGAVVDCGGRVVKHTGDGFFCVFADPSEAAACAVRIQREMASLDGGDAPLRVRIGLHMGEADRRGEDYFGPGVSRAARIAEAGSGGKVLLSRAAANACRIPAGLSVIEHGPQRLRDLEAPVELVELRGGGMPTPSSERLRTLTDIPNNLPEQATLFVGRERELDRLRRLLLDGGTRLVTLHGHGGCGKTRLAVQAGAETAQAFPGGTWLVPLEEVESPGLVSAAVEEAMGMGAEGEEEGLERIAAALSGQPSLLILDNFEHLAGDCGFPSRLLEMTPDVTILVTSRWRLGLREEQLMELTGLGWPGDGRSEEGRFESVELFLHSARRLGRGEGWGRGEMESVHRICAALEGNPLAIELAASWTRLMDPPEIESDLGAILREDGTIRGLPHRHRSVMAVFSYSWNLLEESTARSLVSLAVFRGGFDRSEARRVAGAGLSELSQLMDLSLLRRTPGGLRLHGLVRRFALDKAGEMGMDMEPVRLEHCRVFSELARRLQDSLLKRHEQRSIESLGARLDDVMAGWRYALDTGREELALGYVHSVKSYFAARGLYEEGQDIFGRAAELPGDGEGMRRIRGYALSYASWFRCHSAYDRETIRLAEESVALLRQTGDRWGLALVLNHLGNLHYVSGSYHLSRRALEESLEIRVDIGDKWGETCSLNNLANLACEEKDLEAAERIYRRCLDLFGEMGDVNGVSVALSNLGATALLRDDLHEAMEHLQRAYSLEEERGAVFGMALIRAGMADVKMALGRPGEAGEMYGRSLEEFTELGNRWGETRARLGLAETLTATGDLEEAAGLLMQCARGSLSKGWEPLLVQVAQATAELLERRGRLPEALLLVGHVMAHEATTELVKKRARSLLDQNGAEAPEVDPQKMMDRLLELLEGMGGE
jgi:class 3 adenylate cyclase/predicted ATPase